MNRTSLGTGVLLFVFAVAPVQATHQLPTPAVWWKLDETVLPPDGMTNGGFETYTTSPGVPDSWLLSGGSASSFTRETGTVHSGTNAVRITMPSPTAGQALGKVITGIVTMGVSNTACTWLKQSTSTSQAIRMMVQQNGAGIASTFGITGETSLRQHCVLFTPTMGNEYSIIIEIRSVGQVGDFVIFDDVAVRSSVTADDAIGTRDGTVSASVGTLGATGVQNTAYNFDGVGILSQTAATAVAPSTFFSLTAWFNPDTLPPSTGAYGIVASSQSPTGFRLFIEGTLRLEFDGAPGEIANLQSLGTPFTGQWHFAAATWDATTACLYVNGALQQCVRPGATPIPTSPYQVTIGSLGGEGFPFDGRIDDVRIYDKTLTESQISDLYLAPAHNPCTEQTTQINSVSSSVGTGLIRTLTILGVMVGVLSTIGFVFGRRTGAFILLALTTILAAGTGTPTVAATDPCFITGDAGVDSFSTFTITASFYMALTLLVVGAIALARRG